jgi:hypothetical protein
MVLPPHLRTLLQNGNSMHGNAKDLTGRVFGRLTVISLSGPGTKGRRRLRWKCQCVCDVITVKSSADLLSGRTKSCNCLLKEGAANRFKTKDGTAGLRKAFATRKSQAKHRGILFALTLREFETLVTEPCHYCGQSGTMETFSASKNAEHREQNKFDHNGVDRVDSDRGYAIDNCVSCCSICNVMKNTLTVAEFIYHINLIKARWTA